MLTFTTTMVELRGISNQTNKKGEVYYLVNVEEADGTPYQFYTKDKTVFPDGLRKGDIVDLVFTYRMFNGDGILSLFKVVKPEQ